VPYDPDGADAIDVSLTADGSQRLRPFRSVHPPLSLVDANSYVEGTLLPVTIDGPPSPADVTGTPPPADVDLSVFEHTPSSTVGVTDDIPTAPLQPFDTDRAAAVTLLRSRIQTATPSDQHDVAFRTATIIVGHIRGRNSIRRKAPGHRCHNNAIL
jgi:hypothetical protein